MVSDDQGVVSELMSGADHRSRILADRPAGEAEVVHGVNEMGVAVRARAREVGKAADPCRSICVTLTSVNPGGHCSNIKVLNDGNTEHGLDHRSRTSPPPCGVIMIDRARQRR